ncbi:unnamed protein product [Effrenium voratum]|uniref:Uncharacterized protein n=1 Tax=Effrenium voratum TaxID=2562239 RepID=A0AA36NFZ4_9DINO|nr:unnamed protein product [Effrenium voratum]
MALQKVHFLPLKSSILVSAYPKAPQLCGGAGGHLAQFNSEHPVGLEVSFKNSCASTSAPALAPSAPAAARICTRSTETLSLTLETQAKCSADGSFYYFRVKAGTLPADAVDISTLECELEGPGLNLFDGSCLENLALRRLKFLPLSSSVAVNAYPIASQRCLGQTGHAAEFNSVYQVGQAVQLKRGCPASSAPSAPSLCSKSAQFMVTLMVQSEARCSADGSFYYFKVGAGILPSDLVDISTEECEMQGPHLQVYRDQKCWEAMALRKLHFWPLRSSIVATAYPDGQNCTGPTGHAASL